MVNDEGRALLDDIDRRHLKKHGELRRIDGAPLTDAEVATLVAVTYPDFCEYNADEQAEALETATWCTVVDVVYDLLGQLHAKYRTSTTAALFLRCDADERWAISGHFVELAVLTERMEHES